MKREREKHITRLHIILFFLVICIGIGIYIGFNISKSHKINDYKNLEKDIVSASKIYYKINEINLDDGDEKRININRLKRQGLLQNELADECKGYVLITSEESFNDKYEIVHRAYIKCKNNYTTVNYSEY